MASIKNCIFIIVGNKDIKINLLLIVNFGRKIRQLRNSQETNIVSNMRKCILDLN